MIQFIEYESIENSYREKQIAIIRECGFDKVEWVATEKVHGSNFSLWPTNEGVIPGKRSSFTDGSFYGCQSIVELLSERVKSIGLTIYGEIFGDGIQSGISYGAKRFAAFDMLRGTEYLHYDEFVRICEEYCIERCVEIARGPFDDLLAIDSTFPTRMSKTNNTDIAEGFVMKPVSPLRYPTGSRVILKKKSDKFKESGGPKMKIDVVLTDAQKELLDAVSPHINVERVRSAISKHGKEAKFQTILGEVMEDLYSEVHKDIGQIDGSTWRSISKQTTGAVAVLIRAELFS